MVMRMINSSAIIFADVNFNLLDGSSVWLQSLANILSNIYDGNVYLVLRDKLENDLLKKNVPTDKNVVLIDPSQTKYFDYDFDTTLSPNGFRNICENISRENKVSDIFIRGERYSKSVCDLKKFKNKVTEYYASIPLFLDGFNSFSLRERVGKLKYIAVQTESARSYLESHIPEVNGKVIVFPPTIPDIAFNYSSGEKENYLIYSGKFDADYNVEKYLRIPDLSENQRVIFIGNKFNKKDGDKFFINRMRDSLEKKSSVEWVKGVSRKKTLELASKAEFGLCWRSSLYDSNDEISTKMLEYMAVGTPPLLNKNNASISLLGHDYPFFVDDVNSIVDKLNLAKNDKELYLKTRARCVDIAKNFSFSHVARKLKKVLSRKKVLNG